MLVWGGQTSFSDAFLVLLFGSGSYVNNTTQFLPATNGGARYNQLLNSWSTIPTVPLIANVAERQGATAVWTGTEMLVWGGEYFGQLLRTGARFNPVANVWAGVTTVGAPTARYKHTAVWNGSQMLVWGGTDFAYNTLATGGRYNPATDVWKAIASSNAPAARASHAALWTGSEMLVWGGYQGGLLNPFPTAGGRYNPATDTWKIMNVTNQPTTAAETAAVWSGSEMFVWGGVRNFISTTYHNTGGRYNPTTDSWVSFSTSNAPTARAQHVAAWSGTEYVLFGGRNANTIMNTGGRYNPLTDTWRATSTVNAPAPVTQHTGVWTGNELLVWGGFVNTGLLATAANAFYEPNSDTWRAAASLPYVQFSPIAFGNHCAVWTGRDLIIWGGVSTNYNGTNYNAAPYVYTPGRTMDLMLRP
jgi:N-acetylneuraminic acid mutarotase